MLRLCWRVLKGKGLWGLLLALLLSALIVGGGYGWLQHTISSPVARAQPRTLLFSSGTPLRHMAQQLADADVIPSAKAFEIYVRLNDLQDKLQAGEYLFSPRTTSLEVLQQVMQGRIVLHPLRLVEGWTSDQICAYLNAHPILSGPALEGIPEASLLPETYHVPRGHSRQALIRQISHEHTQYITQLWVARRQDLPYKTPQEALALASLVEKETALAAERPRVAAVFINRLRRGMRLQADPTVIYGLYLQTGIWTPALSRADLAHPTPFNTYLLTGLPPGPICHPSRSAIAAAFTSLESDDLYFVADGSGGHVFACTYAQHQRNHIRWRRIRDQLRVQESMDVAR